GGGWGWLTKCSMAFGSLRARGFAPATRPERRHIGPLLAAIGVALLLYSPNFWWNWSNGFVSYVHVKDNAGIDEPLFHPSAFLEFFGSQFAVFGPLLFAGLIVLGLSPSTLAESRTRLLAT